MSKLTTARTGEGRKVFCTHCGGRTEVAKRAMSVFCPHCMSRLILENYKIRTYHASRLFATCGDIVVERSGHVCAPIRVQNLTVRGRVQGDVQARGWVRVASTGKIRGDIRAVGLIVAGGAVIEGCCHIESPCRARFDGCD